MKFAVSDVSLPDTIMVSGTDGCNDECILFHPGKNREYKAVCVPVGRTQQNTFMLF